jgi:hypothetical protein
MRNCELLCATALSVALAGFPVRAGAQTFENVGVRAQGLGGAFVAVSDDASATWWNPAGLATGATFSGMVERGRTTEPENPTPEGPAKRATAGGFAMAFPALGVSYYRVRISETTASTADTGANRQDPRVGGRRVRSGSVSQFGATMGQSLGDYVVVATTLKVLRGGAGTGVVDSTDALDEADELEMSRSFRVDMDAGVMAAVGHVRLGFVVKNVSRPTFGDGPDALTLKRQARIGIAVLSVPHGALQGITAAADADLTTTSTAVGDVRHAAGGIEAWLANGRLGVRAGVSGNTVGDTRPAGSAGVSVALTRAVHVNASRTMGRDESVTGWSTSVSVSF